MAGGGQSGHVEATGGDVGPAAARRGIAVGGRSGFNPVLDGIRGMAILLVMIYHMTVMEWHGRFDELYGQITGLGWVGVDLFFVLSGFLITGILWDSKGQSDFFRNFYARRTLRIFPLYYAMVFVCLVVLPQLLPAIIQHIADPRAAEVLTSKIDRFGHVRGYEHWFWLYLCNIPMAVQGTYLHVILGVCWSLAIEEQFYLVWPAVVYFCSRERLMRVCQVVFVVALVWRLTLQFGFEANHIAVYVSTFSRMDALVAGAWLALRVRDPAGFDLAAAARWARPLAIGAGSVFVLLAAAETFGSHYDPNNGVGIGHTPWSLTVGLTLLSITFGSVLLMALASPGNRVTAGGRPRGVLNRVFTCGLLRTLGKYAYAMYLFHQPIRAMVRDLVLGPTPAAAIKFREVFGTQLPYQLAYYVLCIGLTFTAAWISWRVFENPLLKLKKYFPSGAERAADHDKIRDKAEMSLSPAGAVAAAPPVPPS